MLNNAAKYTPPGGEIRVSTAIAGGDALIQVTDNGEGIAPEMLERGVRPLRAGERTLARSEGGLGIGLTLARRIVRVHGGDLKAASAGIGKGAEFTVSLPLLVESRI
jgi:signal transduction histidine kinase